MQFVIKKKIGNYLSRTRIKIAEKLNSIIFIEAYLQQHRLTPSPHHKQSHFKRCHNKAFNRHHKTTTAFLRPNGSVLSPCNCVYIKMTHSTRQSFDTFIHRWVHSFWLFNIAWNSSSDVILSFFFIPFSNSLRVEPKSAKSDHLALSICDVNRTKKIKEKFLFLEHPPPP